MYVQALLISCQNVAYTVTPADGIGTVAEVAVTAPELYRFVVRAPSVPNCSTYSVAAAPLLQVKVWLVESVPDEGVSVAGVVVPGSVKV